ncbi:uncharacterized protein LOC111940060 [Cyanistes caeruleus]|uniref:uncharacterized protein LOC111940060 n=1 Tax=Cyanistes caeruleus TaxID=156563 RepID=UPI000CDAB539|nr:uncharacterized protein LOC111940060 [Cyanistes caeruleus]
MMGHPCWVPSWACSASSVSASDPAALARSCCSTATLLVLGPRLGHSSCCCHHGAGHSVVPGRPWGRVFQGLSSCSASLLLSLIPFLLPTAALRSLLPCSACARHCGDDVQGSLCWCQGLEPDVALLAGHCLSGSSSSEGLGKAEAPCWGRAAWRVFDLCIPRELLALPAGSRHRMAVQAPPCCHGGLGVLLALALWLTLLPGEQTGAQGCLSPQGGHWAESWCWEAKVVSRCSAVGRAPWSCQLSQALCPAHAGAGCQQAPLVVQGYPGAGILPGPFYGAQTSLCNGALGESSVLRPSTAV